MLVNYIILNSLKPWYIVKKLYVLMIISKKLYSQIIFEFSGKILLI